MLHPLWPPTQYLAHFSASTRHFSSPALLDALCGSVVRLPESAWAGQTLAHRPQVAQNSVTPKSMGESTTSGKFVTMVVIFTLLAGVSNLVIVHYVLER